MASFSFRRSSRVGGSFFFPVLLGVLVTSLIVNTPIASGGLTAPAVSSGEAVADVAGMAKEGWQTADSATQQQVGAWADQISFGFMPNLGQIADVNGNPAHDVLYVANIKGAQVFVTTSGMSHYFLKRVKRGEKKWGPRREQVPKEYEWRRIDLDLQGATISPERALQEELLPRQGSTNYYLGHCPDGILDVPTYSKITFTNVYPGIDWIVLSRSGEPVHHDFVVHPGADLSQIRLEYKGADEIELSDDGRLLYIRTPLGQVREGALDCYQLDPRNKVAGRFQVDGNLVSFVIDDHDRSQPLIIDPPLVWSTYYGGTNYDGPRTILCDNVNNYVYVVGYTASTNLPVQNAGGGSYFQGTLFSGAMQDGFIWKFTQGGVRLWATYYGGSDFEVNTDCVLDNFSNLYVSGTTWSTNFPIQVLGGAYNQTGSGGAYDGYIIKFNSLGVRQWATYYGGSDGDQVCGITADAAGKIYICGITASADLPLLNPGGGAYFQATLDSLMDAFVARFSALGALEWATYLGGSDNVDQAYGITATASDLYVTGLTNSSMFPTFNPGGGAYFQGALNGGQDAFISRFTLNGVMSWSTYYGGSGEDFGDEPVVDGSGNLYVIGYTLSTDLPTLNPGGGAYFQGSNGGTFDLFLLKFNSANAAQWATYYGGSSDEFLMGGYGKPITVDLQGQLYVTATTFSSDFPVFNPGGGAFYQGSINGPMDAIIGQFGSNGAMLWSTYFGGTQPDFGTGVSIGNHGCLFATGEAIDAGNLVTVDPGMGAYYQSANAGSDDGYIAKFCQATGACCIDFTCIPANSAAECSTLGGTAFYPNQPCSTTECLLSCSICGHKFDDLNKNGVKDVGEPGLAGWTVELYYWNGPLYATTTTDSLGNYCFNDLPCVTWTVSEVLQPNWVQTYPSPNVHTYTMGTATMLNDVDFGNSSCVPDTCCVKPPSGMIAWYPFDEVTPGLAHDIASKTRSGWHYFDQLASAEGVVNGAIVFDSSRYVRVFDDPFMQVDSGDFSIDLWINPSTFSADCQAYPYAPCAAIPILDNRRWISGDEGDNGIMFYLKRVSGAQARLGLAMNVFPNAPDTFETPTAPIVLNEWQHVAVTVDRSSGTPVGTFYYNGQSVGTFTPQLGRVYSTASPGPMMDIGHSTFLSNYGAGQNCDSRERYFIGLMDELEIFPYPLTAIDVQKIYAAGSAGKCKITCSVPSSVVLCKTATTVTFNLTVCNQTPNTSVAKFSFSPGAFGTGCNFNAAGITFSPANGNVTLLPGQCTQMPVTVSRPAGFVPGNIACFCVTVQDTLTKAMSTCCTKLVASNTWCVTVKDPIDVASLNLGESLAFRFAVKNESDSAASFDYTVRAEGSGNATDHSALRLNGLPPGVPVTGSLFLPPWTEEEISGNAILGSFRALELESILLEADVDGDGVAEPLGRVLVQPVSFPDCNNNGIDDALDLLQGTSLDANGNGFPDECEGSLSDPADCYVCGDADGSSLVTVSDAVFLINYIFAGGSAPTPPASGDADCSGVVTISDAVYLINFIFAGGPDPCATCP